MILITTNIVAVAVTAIAPLIIGSIWYSSFAFGKRWMRYEGISSDQNVFAGSRSMFKKCLVAYVTYFCMAYVLSLLVQYLVVAAVFPAIILACVLWLGFVVPAAVSDYLWSPHAKHWGLYYLHVGYFFVSLFVMSIILALWI